MSSDHLPRLPERDRPWMMRTYAGHSTAKASNELYRRNLKKGQTGLSVAFDLPTQTGYDPDDELARGEVGKVGVPVSHRGDMAALMDGFDSVIIGITAPAIAKTLALDVKTFGPVFSAAQFGFMLGAFVAGPLADRFGRKSMAASAAPSPPPADWLAAAN